MGEREAWERIKREESSWLDRWTNQTAAQFWERRRQVKARGYPQGWTECEADEPWDPEGKHGVVLSRVDEGKREMSCQMCYFACPRSCPHWPARPGDPSWVQAVPERLVVRQTRDQAPLCVQTNGADH